MSILVLFSHKIVWTTWGPPGFHMNYRTEILTGLHLICRSFAQYYFNNIILPLHEHGMCFNLFVFNFFQQFFVVHRFHSTSVLFSQFSSVTQSCLTPCDPVTLSTPGLPVHHQLPEFIQTHVCQVCDAIQPSRPLSSSSPPAPNPSEHQGLFQ